MTEWVGEPQRVAAAVKRQLESVPVQTDPITGLPTLGEDPRAWPLCTMPPRPDPPYGCHHKAGERTDHPGFGRCWVHDKTERGQRESALIVSHVIARTLNISPWDALLLAVRRAATWAHFYETKMSECVNDEDLRPGGQHYDWVVAAERVNRDMARYAKMAVDAGVAAMLVQQAQTEGATIARVVNQALGAVELTIAQEQAIRTALRRALLEADSVTMPRTTTDDVTIEGEVAE